MRIEHDFGRFTLDLSIRRGFSLSAYVIGGIIRASHAMLPRETGHLIDSESVVKNIKKRTISDNSD